MTTLLEHGPLGHQLAREGGGWITFRVPQPQTPAIAMDLLSNAMERRPGNLRLALVGKHTHLHGELWDPDRLLALPAAHQRLLASGCEGVARVSESEIACVLGETAHQWSQPQADAGCWEATVPHPSGQPCQLTATVVEGGVEVRSRLATWEHGLEEMCRNAIAHLLAATHAQVRCARFTLDRRGGNCEVSVVSFAAADRLEVELPISVAAVVASCHHTRRELQALASEAVARAYLEVHG